MWCMSSGLLFCAPVLRSILGAQPQRLYCQTILTNPRCVADLSCCRAQFCVFARFCGSLKSGLFSRDVIFFQQESGLVFLSAILCEIQTLSSVKLQNFRSHGIGLVQIPSFSMFPPMASHTGDHRRQLGFQNIHDGTRLDLHD